VARPESAGAVGKKHLTGGAQVSAAERENAADGRREIKKKTYFTKYAKDARGPSGYEASGPGSRWARRLGPVGRPRPVGVAAGPAEAEAQEKN
jgi:hypothetical protein